MACLALKRSQFVSGLHFVLNFFLRLRLCLPFSVFLSHFTYFTRIETLQQFHLSSLCLNDVLSVEYDPSTALCSQGHALILFFPVPALIFSFFLNSLLSPHLVTRLRLMSLHKMPYPRILFLERQKTLCMYSC